MSDKGHQQLRVPLLDKKTYGPVGQCIYCGSTDDLSDEHIVPYGLGGHWVLPKASCPECARITSDFERVVLRGPLRPIRVFRGIQSRRKHRDAPTQLPLRVREKGGEWETIYLPHDEYPLLLEFFVFDVPGYLDPEYENGVRLRGRLTYSFGARPEEVLRRLGVAQIQVTQTHTPGAFARMTAKIAYGMAVALGALDLTKGRPAVVASILGETGDVGRWVGTLTEPLETLEGILYQVSIERDEQKRLLIGRVQYLCDSGTPAYGVILAALDDDIVTDPR